LGKLGNGFERNGDGWKKLGDWSRCIGKDLCSHEKEEVACLYSLHTPVLIAGLTMFPEGTRLKPETKAAVFLFQHVSDFAGSWIRQKKRLADSW
jgi:hypothetical protein